MKETIERVREALGADCPKKAYQVEDDSFFFEWDTTKKNGRYADIEVTPEGNVLAGMVDFRDGRVAGNTVLEENTDASLEEMIRRVRAFVGS